MLWIKIQLSQDCFPYIPCWELVWWLKFCHHWCKFRPPLTPITRCCPGIFWTNLSATTNQKMTIKGHVLPPIIATYSSIVGVSYNPTIQSHIRTSVSFHNSQIGAEKYSILSSIIHCQPLSLNQSLRLWFFDSTFSLVLTS